MYIYIYTCIIGMCMCSMHKSTYTNCMYVASAKIMLTLTDREAAR